jgi:hypothetical protein
MEKEFVPYQIALDMKSIGFDEPCFAWYVSGSYGLEYGEVIKSDLIRDGIVAPTFSQAFRWFRENGYYYGIEICQEKHPSKSKYSFSLYGKDFYEEYPKEYGWIDDFPRFNSYEEAELECIKKLIEIVKEK